MLVFRHSCNRFAYFKRLSYPIFQLKKLILTNSVHQIYYFDLNELTIITQLFPTLEYLQLAIKDLQDLTILINGLTHLISLNILYKKTAADGNYLQHLMQQYATKYKFKWVLEKDTITIWLY